MRRAQIALLATLQLCSAKQHSFSIHDDVLAYPQFEVVFSDSYILENEATALLSRADRHSGSPTYEAQFSQTDLSSQIRESAAAEDVLSEKGQSPSPGAYGDDAGDGSPQVSETYEVMTFPPSRYLCSIPVLALPPPVNHTATELAKAEEAREHSRASTRGWELMQPLNGQCMYFVSGWWSYSFCYGKEVVQFHATTSSLKAGGPPTRDPQSQEYVLGRSLEPTSSHGTERKGASKQQEVLKQDQPVNPPPNTELQVKGDQRYLVQRLGAGTICDLTGRERTIEIQYHCNPGGSTDRINWIREVTTCTYLMEIRTPRLCEDLAFLPPKPTRAHPINCRLIVASASHDSLPGHSQKKSTSNQKTGLTDKLGIDSERVRAGQSKNDNRIQAPKGYQGLNIGGVIVGGRQALGTGEDGAPAAKLAVPSRGSAKAAAALATLLGKMTASQGGRVMEVLAQGQGRAGGGQVTMLSNEELQALNLKPEAVDELRRELATLAGDRSWRLEVIELADGVTEVRAVMDSEDDGQVEEFEAEKKGAAKMKTKKVAKPKDRAKEKEQGTEAERRSGNAITKGKAKGTQPEEEEEDQQEGSEEVFFNEEL